MPKGNIPITSAIHACGIMPETHHNPSVVWNARTNAAADYALQEADCIIALGSRFDDRTTGLVSEYAPKAFEAYQNGTGGIIHVNIEESEIGKVIDSHCTKYIVSEILERGINTKCIIKGIIGLIL